MAEDDFGSGGRSVLYGAWGVAVYYKSLERLARFMELSRLSCGQIGYKRKLALPLSTATDRTTRRDADDGL